MATKAAAFGRYSRNNTLDKLCAALAFLLGVLLLVLGGIGLFMGCKANSSLPPVLGAIPAFAGWGIVRAVYFVWTRPERDSEDAATAGKGDSDQFTLRLRCIGGEPAFAAMSPNCPRSFPDR